MPKKEKKLRGKTIQLIVSFWTNNTGDRKPLDGGAFAHESGEVYMRNDNINGVRTKRAHFFQRRSELDKAITDALEDAGIILLKH